MQKFSVSLFLFLPFLAKMRKTQSNSAQSWYHPEETNNIFCADMDLITGRGIEGFQVPCMWPTVPYGYLFSTGIEDFIPYYKKSAKVLGASRMKDIQIRHSENNLNVRLFY